MSRIKRSYLSPLLDLELGHMLDGDLVTVQAADPGVDNAKAALAQHRPHLVLLLELVRVGPKHPALRLTALHQTRTLQNEANPECYKIFTT
jgi:hypothetical protein